MSRDEIHSACRIDPWFIERIAEIVALENKVNARRYHRTQKICELKFAGFSDARLATLANTPEAKVSQLRQQAGRAPGL